MSDYGGFHVGDSVCVAGAVSPFCISLCGQGNGCIDVTGIEGPVSCVGDCNGDGRVTVDELVSCGDLALDIGMLRCLACDADGDGDVTVGDLVTAVNNALNGCPASLTSATPTPCLTCPTPAIPRDAVPPV